MPPPGLVICHSFAAPAIHVLELRWPCKVKVEAQYSKLPFVINSALAEPVADNTTVKIIINVFFMNLRIIYSVLTKCEQAKGDNLEANNKLICQLLDFVGGQGAIVNSNIINLAGEISATINENTYLYISVPCCIDGFR